MAANHKRTISFRVGGVQIRKKIVQIKGPLEIQRCIFHQKIAVWLGLIMWGSWLFAAAIVSSSPCNNCQGSCHACSPVNYPSFFIFATAGVDFDGLGDNFCPIDALNKSGDSESYGINEKTNNPLSFSFDY